MANFVQFSVPEVVHPRSLGEVLTQEAIEVFVGSSFPRVVGGSEIAGDSEPLLEPFVRVELCAVIEGDSFEQVGFCGNDAADGSIGLSCGPVENFGYFGKPGLAFNEGNDALELIGAHYRVTFPVAELRTIATAGGAVADPKFSFESTYVILRPVTLSASFWNNSQVFEQFTASASILLDPSIDRRNADR